MPNYATALITMRIFNQTYYCTLWLLLAVPVPVWHLLITTEDFHARTKKVTYLALASFSTIRFSTLESIGSMKIVAIGAKIMML